jgi:hypothetical protein
VSTDKNYDLWYKDIARPFVLGVIPFVSLLLLSVLIILKIRKVRS